MTFSVILTPEASEQLSRIDRSMRGQLGKKLTQMEREDLMSRHMKLGLPYNVVEVGQYRICFRINIQNKIKWVYFIGDHKEYEKWVKT